MSEEESYPNYSYPSYVKHPSKRKPRKIKMEWTDENVKALIHAVQAEPFLWNTAYEEHKNHKKRDAAWKSISENLFGNVDPNELNYKWQNLRCQYKDCRNKLKKNANHSVRWRYFEHLKFLDEVFSNETDAYSNPWYPVSSSFIGC
uniref:MADF domain-containing protein n=1 Tax=Cacopsylla melanoneura TaxID=428564 RepID=A0A8D8STL8_9HEMI